MSKRDFKKWFNRYRSVTEVEPRGVDQWVYEDVEKAYIEGVWQGRVNAAKWLLKEIPSEYSVYLTDILKENIKFFQRKLDREMEKRNGKDSRMLKLVTRDERKF